MSVYRYRQYAADCVRQAQSEDTPEDRTIMLNVALAWLRLAQQTEAARGDFAPLAPELEPQDVLWDDSAAPELGARDLDAVEIIPAN
jgi:hypothetical protein